MLIESMCSSSWSAYLFEKLTKPPSPEFKEFFMGGSLARSKMESFHEGGNNASSSPCS